MIYNSISFYRNIKYALYFSLIIFAIISCNPTESKRKPIANKNPLIGNWICSDLLDSIKFLKKDSSIFSKLELPYAYEFIFDEKVKDSIFVSNGFEQYYLPIQQHGDSIILLSAMQDHNLILIKDSATTKLTLLALKDSNINIPTHTYIKATEDDLQDMGTYFEAFPTAFNKSTIAGNYQLVEKNQLLDFKVSFKPDGTIEGLKDAYLYRCCIAGDCLNMIPYNIISVLYKTKNNEEMAWYFKGDTLLLYPLHNSKINEPGHWRKGKSVIKLIVLKPE